METKKGLIIYRGNDLLDINTSIIKSALGKIGYEVNTQRFPLGTEEEQINEWITANLQDLSKHNLILRDYTLTRSAYKLIKDNIPSLLNEKFDLDEIVEEAYFIELAGKGKEHLRFTGSGDSEKKYSSLEEGLADTKEAYLNLLNRIKYLPKTVYIEDEKLSDHTPFNILRTKDDDYYLDREADRKAGEILSEWFKESGVEEVKLIISNEDYPDINKKGAWMVCDRHTKNKDSEFKEYFTVLYTPFCNFLRDLKEQGLTESNIDIKKTLENYVIERFK